MNATAIFKITRDGRDEPQAPRAAGWPHDARGMIAGVGLWVFMGVATTLFSLFLAAYVMRMDSSDWSPIALPPQLWLSTALLIASGVLLQRAAVAAHAVWLHRARMLLLTAGACALAFLAVQLWAWQALLAMQVTATGNPAGSFFYLLTAMHGLHVAGGLVGWGIAVRGTLRVEAALHPARTASRIALCARYWHFLLAVWLVLYAALGWLTPEAVRFICGTR